MARPKRGLTSESGEETAEGRLRQARRRNRASGLPGQKRMTEVDTRKDYAAFLNSANYPLVKQTDMTAEERDSAVDICIVAVEKHSSDMEKCTQASPLVGV